MLGKNSGQLAHEQLFGVSYVKKYDSNEIFVCNRVNLQKVYKIIRQERLLKVLQWENGEWQNAQKNRKTSKILKMEFSTYSH